MQLLALVFSAALLEAVQSTISGFGDQTAGYGGEAHYRCAVTKMPGVAQVTWQRLFKNKSIENLATYSKRFGQQVNEPHQGKMAFAEASLSSSAITVKNLTWADESCYICSFSVYPEGSSRRQTCLTVNGISEVTTAVHPSSHKPEGESVEITCSATGKPAPTIEWDFPTPGLLFSLSPITTQANSDSTFTSARNISLEVPPDWSGYVDCLVNSGMMGERRERIPLMLDPEKREKHTGNTFSSFLVALIVFLCILGPAVIAAAMFKRFKSIQHETRPQLYI